MVEKATRSDTDCCKIIRNLIQRRFQIVTLEHQGTPVLGHVELRTPQHSHRLFSCFVMSVKNIRALLVGAVMLNALRVITGWLSDVEILKHPLAGNVATSPLTSTCILILCGILWMYIHGKTTAFFQRALLWLLIIVTTYNCVSLVFQIPFKIDQTIFPQIVSTDVSKTLNRMSVVSSINVMTLCLALLIIEKQVRLAQWLALCIALINISFTLAYLYQVPELQFAAPSLPLSAHSAISFFLLSISVLLARHDKGWVKIYTSELEGGRLSRLVLPAIIFIPMIIGYFRFWAFRLELFSPELGIMLVISFIIISLLSIFSFVSIRLNSRDKQRREMETKLAGVNKQLQSSVEEMAALNEELMASNEEFQSTNELLTTLNSQLEEANKIIAEQKDEQLNQVLTSTDNIAWSRDLNGFGNQYLSRSIEKVTGYNADDFKNGNINWSDLINETDKAIEENAIAQLAHADLVETEYRITTKEGIVKWIRMQYRNIRNKEGKIVSEEKFASDISAVKKAQSALIDERNLLRSIIDNIPDLIFVKDENANHIINNKANLEILGVQTEAESFGKSVTDFLKRDEVETYLDDDLQVFSSGIPQYNKEEIIHDQAGNQHVFLTTKVPLKDEDGKIVGLVGISRDVTESKSQQRHLQETLENLDIIFSNTIEGIMLFDNKGKLIHFNKAASETIIKLTNTRAREGQYLWDLTAPKRRSRKLELFQNLIDKKLPVIFETVVPGFSQNEIHEFRYAPIELNGAIKYIIATSMDVSEKKRQEEFLNQYRENLNIIFSNTQEEIMLLDSEGRVLLFNQALSRITELATGKPPKTGEFVWETTVAERREITKTLFNRAVHGESIKMDATMVIPSGDVIHEIRYQPVYVDASVKFVFIVSKDVTEARRRELTIRQSEANLRALFDNTDDAFTLLDRQRNILLENTRSQQISAVGSRPGVNILTLLPEGRKATFASYLKRVEDGETVQYEINPMSDPEKWYEVSIAPVKDADTLHGFCITTRDLSRIKKVEMSLRAREQEVLKLNSSLADFQHAIYNSSIVSRADRQGRITFVNENFVNISGYSADDLIGKNHRIINSGFHPKSFWTTMWKTIAAGHLWRQDVKNRSKGGQYYWVDTFIMPFVNPDGEVTEFLSIRNDITERKKSEEELTRNKLLLDTANEIANIGYWTYNVGTGIISFSDQTIRIFGLPANFSCDLREYFNLIDERDLEMVTDTLQRTLITGTAYNMDYRVMTIPGIHRWIHEEVKVEFDDGRVSTLLGVIQDITQRKAVEEILLEYNEKFEILSKATNDAIWDWDINHDFIIWNHGLEKLFGYSETEVVDVEKWWKEKIHPDDYARINADIVTCFTEGRTNWEATYRYRCSAGHYKHVLDRAYVMYNNNQRPVRMIGAIQDITQQIESIAEIEKLSVVASKTNNSVTITDNQGRIEWVNESFQKMTGYSLEEVKGRTMEFLQGPETDNAAKRRIREKLNRNEPLAVELLNYTKEGKKFWINLSITPVFSDDAMSVKNYISVQLDITERKEFENSLSAIARELASLIENANVPIFGIDLQGRINEWNHVAHDVTGYSKADAMGVAATDFLFERSVLPVYNAMVTDVIDGEKVGTIELAIVTKSKQRLILLFSASTRRNAHNEIAGVIFVTQNITELSDYRKNLELKVTERTRELNEALSKERELVEMKSRFVSIASHEFRTPLSTIASATGLIRKHQTKLTPEDIDNRLKNIEKQVQHMTFMLDDVLMVDKADAGKLKIQVSEINLLEFLPNLCAEVEKSRGGTHIIRFEQRLLVTTIMTDEKLLRSIVINLLTNAIKFSPDASIVDVTVVSDKTKLELTVKDYGIGIPEDDLKNLFEPFFRGGNVNTIQGTGLGLSILRKSLELLQGSVMLKSTVGDGTEITISLPI